MNTTWHECPIHMKERTNMLTSHNFYNWRTSNTHTHIYIYIYIYMCVCVCVCVCACVCACVRVCVCVYVYIDMFIHIYLYLYISIYIYIYLYIYIYISFFRLCNIRVYPEISREPIDECSTFPLFGRQLSAVNYHHVRWTCWNATDESMRAFAVLTAYESLTQ